MTGRAAVLVIDDEAGIREMLTYELSEEGYDVETVESGFAAVAAVKRRRFDLALTDLKMPGMDGMATVEALRALDPDIEVIVATGYASVETAVNCMKLGAYDYIQKPYDLAEFRLLLERAMEKSHLQGVVALYEASRALSTTLKHSELVSLVLTLSKRVLHADDVVLFLPGAGPLGAQVHRLEETAGPDAVVLAGLVEKVMEADAPLCLPLPAASRPVESGRQAAAFALVCPLAAKVRRPGALIILRRDTSPPFTSFELRKGSVFAVQLALSLDNVRLFEELEHKVSELVSTQEHLLRAEKMALAGHLAGAVAHEINNPLAVIRANLGALHDYSTMLGELWLSAKAAALFLRNQLDPEANEHARQLMLSGGSEERTDARIREMAAVIDESIEGVKRIADLVDSFAILAHPQDTSEQECVDLNELVRECLAALPCQTRHEFRAGAPGTARASRSDLRTALLNLMAFVCAPGRSHSGSHGAMSVSSEVLAGRPCVVISDETVRLSAEERRRLFDPRIEVDTGRGRTLRLNLALPLAYQMLRRNGAEVSMSEAGEPGIAFRISLQPATTSDVPHA